MKKLLFAALLGSTVLSFAQKKGMVHLEVELADKAVKEIKLGSTFDEFTKTIQADENGLFKDNINVKPGIYYLRYGSGYQSLFLKNNADLLMKLSVEKDINDFTGSLSPENQYLEKFDMALYNMDNYTNILSANHKSDFEIKLKNMLDEKNKELNNSNFAPEFALSMKPNMETLEDFVKKKYEYSLLKDKPFPDFEFENYNGGTSKLSDFKGKYLYIDIWATWCSPCKYEMPHLKKLEERYHGKNIEFISIASDQAKAKDLWRTMIKEKEMTGVQLFANKKLSADEFGEKISLSGMPRFILVGPDGKIIDADTLRPSKKKLTNQLDKLLN